MILDPHDSIHTVPDSCNTAVTCPALRDLVELISERTNDLELIGHYTGDLILMKHETDHLELVGLCADSS